MEDVKRHHDHKGRPLKVGDHVRLSGTVIALHANRYIDVRLDGGLTVRVLGDDLEIGPPPAPGGPGDPGEKNPGG